MVKTKRVCELEEKDVFEFYGVTFKVSKIDNKRVYYRPLIYGQSYGRYSFGKRSMMKVLITGKIIIGKRNKEIIKSVI